MDASRRSHPSLRRRASVLVAAASLLLAAPGAASAQRIDAAPVAAHDSQVSTRIWYGNSDSEYVRFVELVYSDLLGRTLDETGLAGWVALLDGSGPRIVVANGITSSREYRARLVAGSYDRYLGRAPDPAGLEAWLLAMAGGSTVAQLEAGLIGSAEYYARAGSTDAGWVTQLYADVLQRTAAGTEIAAWTDALSAGASRQAVSMGFLLATEHLSTVVDGWYRQLLGRGTDPAGQAAWVAILQAGGRDEAIIGGIVASEEYWRRATYPGQLDLLPASAVISLGSSVTYRVDGYSTLGMFLEHMSGLATLSVDGDASLCAGTTCTPLTVGDHVVTAVVARVSTTAVLHVGPA